MAGGDLLPLQEPPTVDGVLSTKDHHELGATGRKVSDAVQALQARATTEWTARFVRGCAGMFGCGDVTCRLCTIVAKLPQPASRHADAIHDRDKTNAERDGERPDKDNRNLAFKKRHRVGPLR